MRSYPTYESEFRIHKNVCWIYFTNAVKVTMHSHDRMPVRAAVCAHVGERCISSVCSVIFARRFIVRTSKMHLFLHEFFLEREKEEGGAKSKRRGSRVRTRPGQAGGWSWSELVFYLLLPVPVKSFILFINFELFSDKMPFFRCHP